MSGGVDSGAHARGGCERLEKNTGVRLESHTDLTLFFCASEGAVQSLLLLVLR